MNKFYTLLEIIQNTNFIYSSTIVAVLIFLIFSWFFGLFTLVQHFFIFRKSCFELREHILEHFTLYTFLIVFNIILTLIILKFFLFLNSLDVIGLLFIFISLINIYFSKHLILELKEIKK